MQTVRRKITELRDHPQQQHVYGDLNPVEFQTLKRDLKELGQRQPIEVTADGTIIDGHQRVRALQELGHKEVDVIVREDLSDDRRDEMFLYANLVRRQLDPVAKARALTEIARLVAEQKGHTGDVTQQTDFREWLAGRVGGGISGRTVGRYLQLLRLPRPLQDAVSEGQLAMTLALKVEALDGDEQQAIAERIAAGEPPKTVVREALEAAASHDDDLEDVNEPAADDDSPQSWYAYFVARFEEKVPEFEAAPHALVGMAGDHEQTAATLARAAEFFTWMSQLELQAAAGVAEAASAL